jgi:alkaline phosphatase D
MVEKKTKEIPFHKEKESAHAQEGLTKPASFSENPLTRRDFLRLSAAGAVALAVGGACGGIDPEEEKRRQEEERIRQAQARCQTDAASDQAKELAFDPTAIKEDLDRYFLGVQAGSITAQGALLWTFTGDEKPRTLRVWRPSEKSGSVLLVAEKEVTPKEGYIHENIEGLAAGHEYFYTFLDKQGDAFQDRTRIGRFRTAFADGCLQPLVIAASACTNAGKHRRFKALEIMAKRKADIFCHLGDMSYNDGAETTQEFRAKWHRTFKTPGYGELYASTGLYAVWDDHEYTDNNGLYDKPASFFDIARKAYFEHVAQDPSNNMRLWRSYKWGDTAEFFLVDGRTERRVETYRTDNAIYLSDAQFNWLMDGIKKSPCHFKIILNSVPIIDFPDLWDAVEYDRWEGYKTQRKKLFEMISQEKIRNVWFLSGDLHVGTVARVDPTGPMSETWEILAGPGGNDNLLWNVYQASEENKNIIAPEAQFPFFHGALTATLITLDPIKDEVRVEFIDAETEQVLHDKTYKQGFPQS